MSVILRNEQGAIAINKGVLEKMIISDLLDMPDSVILCNKKGKQIKVKSSRQPDADLLDCIEIYEKKKVVKIKLFIISIFGHSISNIADNIFSVIENDFELLKLSKPGSISINVKGVVMPDQPEEIVKRNIEVVRKNK